MHDMLTQLKDISPGDKILLQSVSKNAALLDLIRQEQSALNGAILQIDFSQMEVNRDISTNAARLQTQLREWEAFEKFLEDIRSEIPEGA